MSYSCLPNMKNFINLHNQKILKTKNLSTKDCNCRNTTKCTFNGHCLAKGTYKATICCPKGNKEYVGSTGTSFKSRFNQHKHSLNSNKSHQNTLSKSNKNSISKIKWSILCKIKECIHEKSDDCSICNLERMAIAEMDRENP